MPKFKVNVAETTRTYYESVEVEAPDGERAVELAIAMASNGQLSEGNGNTDWEDTEIAA